MKVTTTDKGCYSVMLSDTEQIIVDELAAIYDMTSSDIVKMMFTFSSYMAVTRILNQINES